MNSARDLTAHAETELVRLLEREGRLDQLAPRRGLRVVRAVPALRRRDVLGRCPAHRVRPRRLDAQPHLDRSRRPRRTASRSPPPSSPRPRRRRCGSTDRTARTTPPSPRRLLALTPTAETDHSVASRPGKQRIDQGERRGQSRSSSSWTVSPVARSAERRKNGPVASLITTVAMMIGRELLAAGAEVRGDRRGQGQGDARPGACRRAKQPGVPRRARPPHA